MGESEKLQDARLNFDQRKKQSELLDHGSSWACFDFVRRTPGADIEGLQRRALEDGEPWGLVCFASLIRDRNIFLKHSADQVALIDIPALEAAILKNGRANDLFEFCDRIRCVNVLAAWERVKKVGSEYEIRRFGRRFVNEIHRAMARSAASGIEGPARLDDRRKHFEEEVGCSVPMAGMGGRV